MELPRRAGAQRPAGWLPLRAQARGGRGTTDLCGHRAPEHIARSIPTAAGLDYALTPCPPQLALSPVWARRGTGRSSKPANRCGPSAHCRGDEVRGAREHRELGLRETCQVPHYAAPEQPEHIDGVLEADGIGIPDDKQGGRLNPPDVLLRPGKGLHVESF